MMRYLLWLLIPIVGLVALVAAYDRMQMVAWIGGYEVRVTTIRIRDRPIKNVSVAKLLNAEWSAMEGDPLRIESWRSVLLSPDGSFDLHVKCWGGRSGLNWTNQYAREEVMVLRIDYVDGTQHLVAMDIPEHHGGKDLTLFIRL